MSERNLICKNDLIDATKKCSSTQLNIFYNLLYLSKEQKAFDPDLKESEVTYVSVEKLEQRLDCRKHLTKKELIGVVSGIPKGIYSKDKQEYIAVFSFIRYDEECRDFSFKITEDIKPYLYDVMEKFTVLELKSLALLESNYAKRMYEFGSKCKNMGTYLMPILDFREYFKVPKTYNIGSIDARILNPSINAVNEIAQFTIKAEKVKARNRVTHIKFKFKAKG